MSLNKIGSLVAAVLAAWLVASCGSEVARERQLALASCRLPNLPTAAQCGELTVPENRARPDGRTIRIFAALLPANTVSPKDDPLLILAGGPGQAASQLAPFAARLTELRRTRDVVIIDQRGTGRSSPLTCAALQPRDDDAFDTDPVPRARECLAEIEAQGVDPAQYTTTAWIADLEAMREALGYAQWNLWGGSYGTRVAQEYLRRHPARIRTVTLDGVAPPSLAIILDVWRTRDAALATILAACAASVPCRTAHPEPAQMLARVAAALVPDGRDVDLVDPRTGTVARAHVTFDTVLAALQPLTYAPEMATLIPEMLALAEGGDYGPLFSATQSMAGNFSEQLNPALHFSVTCAEDFPRIKTGDADRAPAAFASRELAKKVAEVCSFWPRGTVPADFANPLTSDKPALLFSGGMDPVTPPSYGAEVAREFPNSRHVIAPGYGHIVSPHACAPRLIAAFVDAAGFGTLSASCIAYFEKSVPPPLWSGRLEPSP